MTASNPKKPQSPNPDLTISDPCRQSGSSPPTNPPTDEVVHPLGGAANDDIEPPPPARPCRPDAEKFIEALAGSVDAKVTFQTFADDKEKGGTPAQVLHGTLEQHWEQLVALNRGGHGVFVMVNEGDGRGRKETNVTAVRALFIDDDGEGSVPATFVAEGQPPFSGPPPSITVETKRGEHNYWLLKPGAPKESFTAAQAALASHFETDPTVKDLPRVMRVPGFFHMKNPAEPFLVKLVQARADRYDLNEVLEAYPARSPVPCTSTQAVPAPGVAPCPLPGEPVEAVHSEEALREACAYVAKVPAAIQGQGGDKDTFKLCATLTRGFNLSDDAALAVLAGWNASCQPPWEAPDLLRKVQDARTKGKEAIGGRLRSSKQSQRDAVTALIMNRCVPLLNSGFALYRGADGVERVFAVNDRKEATFLLCESSLKQVLHDGLKVLLGEPPGERLIDRAITLWKRECLRLSAEPEPFCFADDDRLCFKRFDWVPAEAPFPAWEEFLTRLSDRQAFMAYVWSCFEKANESRQLVWLRGNGQDGKSKVIGVLTDVFGSAAAAINNTQVTKGSQFFFSLLYGKRVVLYPDCKNTRFAMTELVRNFTSGDPVPVEFKNQTPFTIRLRVKLFVGANVKPEITSGTADESRLIYVEVSKSKETDDPIWGTRLTAELPGFLFACRETYRRICPKGGDIPLNDDSKELRGEASAAFEERFAEIFERYFVAAPEAVTKAGLVSSILRSDRLDNNEQADFKTWMERKYSVRYRPKRDGRVYEGLRLLHPKLSEFYR